MIPEKLYDFSLFSELNPEERTLLEKDFQPTSLRFNPGQICFLQGDPLDHLLLVIHGRVSAEIPDASGKVFKVESLEAPAVAAGGLLFSTQNTLPVQLIAETQVEIVQFSRADTLRLLSRFPSLLESFLRDMGDKIDFLAEKLRIQKFQSLRQKIAGHFLGLHKRSGKIELRVESSMDRLADLFGVSRPSLSRSLSVLCDQGVIHRLGKGAFRIEPDKLKEILLEL